ncbi:MAG: hypothetical protein ACYCT9_11465 [Leptospirillum sp.]|jgi:hypothetical protein
MSDQFLKPQFWSEDFYQEGLNRNPMGRGQTREIACQGFNSGSPDAYGLKMIEVAMLLPSG